MEIKQWVVIYHMHRKPKGLVTMPSNNSKYSEETSERTSKFIS